VPVVEASVEPTVSALLAYLRERDRQRDAEVAELRADLAQARADQVSQAEQLAQAQERLRALEAPQLFQDANLGGASRSEAQESPHNRADSWRAYVPL